jgi:hypothetical protein
VGENSVIKTIHQARPKTHWGRFEEDGAPLMHEGQPPSIRKEEASRVLKSISKWYYADFDLSDPDQKENGFTLVQLMDACANQYFKLVDRERYKVETPEGGVKWRMYVEWVETHKEADKRYYDPYSPPPDNDDGFQEGFKLYS